MRLDVRATQEQIDERAAATDDYIKQFRTMTPAQAAAWVDTNVTDLASAKRVLKFMVKALVVMIRRLLPDVP